MHPSRSSRSATVASRSRRRPEGTSYRIVLPRGPAVRLGPAAPSPGTVTGQGGQQASIDGSTVTVTQPDATTVELSGHRARRHIGRLLRRWSAGRDGLRRSRRKDLGCPYGGAAAGASGPLRDRLRRTLQSRRPLGRHGRPGYGGSLGRRQRQADLLSSRGTTGKLLSVAFAPDGRRIATGGMDGTVRQYRCTICGGTSRARRPRGSAAGADRACADGRRAPQPLGL